MEKPPQTIPTAWYFDDAVYAAEEKNLFQQSPYYVGHELMTPEVGNFYVSKHTHDAKVLVRHKEDINLISNVCRHHQALMLKDSGKISKIICPIHSWAYDLEGTLLKAPNFEETPCLSLPRISLQKWNGLLFAGENTVDDSSIPSELGSHLDFKDYAFGGAYSQDYHFNWKIFIETYLDDYHINAFHPGLRTLVDTREISWQLDQKHSAQMVGFQKSTLKTSSQNYALWREIMLSYNDGKPFDYGAIWFTYYPYLMIERYPYMLIISTLIPAGPNACQNVTEFFYPQDMVESNAELIQVSQAAYNETAKEDEEICLAIQNGRHALYKSNLNTWGPYHPTMEAGLPFFHQFVVDGMDK